ncbi:MAG TPA: GNAT family N-acetyltransferase [Lunatimonas sp.]|nr:GNAT family N-acetyltransferase [Lunatimonas sp.]
MENKPIEITEVGLDKVLEIRREVMWPDKPISFVEVSGDSEAVHLGLFENGTVVSVISLFIENERAQFRKFATLTSFQRKGYGTTLLQYVFEYLKSKQIKRVTCNARVEKADFYASFGMKRTPNTFEKEQVAYVVMEKILKT